MYGGEDHKVQLKKHIHSYEWESDETAHWQEFECGAGQNRETHSYDNDSDRSCDTCGYERTLPDTQPPTGEIEIATGNLTSVRWTEFLAPDKITFHLFFKDKKWDCTVILGPEPDRSCTCGGCEKWFSDAEGDTGDNE